MPDDYFSDFSPDHAPAANGCAENQKEA